MVVYIKQHTFVHRVGQSLAVNQTPQPASQKLYVRNDTSKAYRSRIGPSDIFNFIYGGRIRIIVAPVYVDISAIAFCEIIEHP